MSKIYDVIVVGAGAGGLTAAYTAKGFSKSVLLLDKSRPGGECTWSGCVPSKALIHLAEEVHQARNHLPTLTVESSAILEKVRKVILSVYREEAPDALKRDGIDFRQGMASFVAPHTLRVGKEFFTGRKIILATGSSPLVPPIPGLDTVPYLTNENFFTQDVLPRSIILLGGGPIGVELAHALQRLGVKVQVVEMMDRILFREEPDLVTHLEQRLKKEGIVLHTGTKAVSVSRKGSGIALLVEKNGQDQVIEGDALLLALGRTPNLQGLQLERAGIRYSRKGILTNRRMETSAKGVYAVGDVVGPYQFSHMANMQGIVAVQNALLPWNRNMSYDHVAWVTFTDPELGRAGMTEEEARARHGDGIRVYTQSYQQLDRAKTKRGSVGLVKIIVDRKGRILGASILGDRAGELISELQVLKTLGIPLGKLKDVIHPYPTYSEILVKIAKRVYVDTLLGRPLVKLVYNLMK